jgi:decaprenylphospho-beta-D-ribofuranose 2-oxidase
VDDGARSTTALTGWGSTAPSVARLVEVARGELVPAIAAAGPRGALVRGLGRSYGDAAQNAGGTVIRLREGADPIRVDTEHGIATVDAATSFDELMRAIVPLGYFVPVTPGTRFVTVGGAIASDIHGKNHHVEGSFGNHVTSLRLLTADGVVHDLSPHSSHADAELYWATIGGMGLTGVILDATFCLLPIETSRCVVDTSRAPDLDAVLALMEEGDHRYRYSVAWVDLLATGRHLGRSVLTRGDHARRDQLPARTADPLSFDPRPLVTVPPGIPNVLRHPSVAGFNELWYRRAPRHRTGEIQTIGRFFHPLDGVTRWNRLYGRRGFLQYQFVVPFGEELALQRTVERLADSGGASFLVVLKRFGRSNPAPLSFPTEGWTITFDIPATARGLAQLLHELDALVLEAGGRHYLAKDSHTTPEAIRRGYPRLAEWQAVRRRVDPHGAWASDLARRLELID